MAQERFGNEWINSQQEYIKVLISSDGVYEITGSDLKAAGWDLNTIESRKLQLFHLGKEVAIKVETESSIFSEIDRIIFYAEKNKGDLDSLLYRPSSERMNLHQSLLSDDAAYFLSFGQQDGKRVEQVPFQNQAVAQYQMVRQLESYESQYSFNNIIGLLPNLQQSYYEEGEGWSGVFLSSDSTSNFNINLTDYLVGTGKVSKLRMQLNGRSRNRHKIVYSINDVFQSDTLNFGDFEKFEKEIDLSEEMMVSGEIKLAFSPIAQETFDWFSVTNFELDYPQKLDGATHIFGEENINYPAASAAGVLMISDKWNVTEATIQDATFTSDKPADYYAYSEIKKPRISAVVDLIGTRNTETNFIILTDKSLLEGAQAYADYRSSESGGGFVTLVTTSESLYNRFTYGQRNPEAVRRFADFMLQDTEETKHLFLVGRAVTFPDVLKAWQEQDLVPSYGYPGSDVLLTAGTGARDIDVQGMSTGRLNVTNNEEIMAYLAKVQETEAAPKGQAWKKRMLHLSGGKTPIEISSLAQILENIETRAEKFNLGGQVSSQRKQSLEEIEETDISAAVNQGLGMITFAGHGSANVIDLNIGYCSDPTKGFNNKGKYPLMFFNGCGVGNVFYRYDPLTTDWLLTPEKGAIAVFANSFWSYLLPTQIYLNSLYEKLFVDAQTINLSLGEIQQAVNKELALIKGNPYVLANMHQMVLQGDPAIKMFPLAAADFAALEEGMFLKSTDLSKPMNQNDSLWLSVPVQNLGRFDSTQLVTIRTDMDGNGSRASSETILPSFAFEKTIRVKVPNVISLTKVTLTLNPDKNLDELTFDNNAASLSFDNWQETGAYTSFPDNSIPDKVGPLLTVVINGKQIENGDYIAANSEIQATLIDENAFSSGDENYVKMYLAGADSEIYGLLDLSSVSLEDANAYLAKARLDLAPGLYKLKVEGQDAKGNSISNPYIISFMVSEGTLNSSLSAYPNPVLSGLNLHVGFQLISSINPAKTDLEIYSSTGALVLSERLNATVGNNITSLDLNSLSSGVYVVKVRIDWSVKEDILTSKIVIP